ncbi:hypothetical protein C8A05DRAFT_38365 [Staphylotrichum tortipilum]|uniref:Uncharacterized protein n=1 Tax=Staphylotrichum tortipilum TaxID=2831512 RepID=A0AAN6MBY9_9PEZI|nr:hypothetical protein C8A05DRAFT_38365 [Staphylotrichum longicolle]
MTTKTSPTTTTTTTTTATTTTTSASTVFLTWNFDTAFGYQAPVNGMPNSFELDTQSGTGCNRSGWYETSTLDSLQHAGINGPLYVGAGRNDISKAISMGSWTATASPEGNVKAIYQLNSPQYSLAEV